MPCPPRAKKIALSDGSASQFHERGKALVSAPAKSPELLSRFEARTGLQSEPASVLQTRPRARRIDRTRERRDADSIPCDQGRRKLGGEHRASHDFRRMAGEFGKPDLVPARKRVTVIPLRTTLPPSSSNLPESADPEETFEILGTGGPKSLPYSVLLRMGFAVPLPSPVERCALTAPFHPCLNDNAVPAVYSLLHFPSRRRASPLASMLPVGVRTFLSRPRATATVLNSPAALHHTSPSADRSPSRSPGQPPRALPRSFCHQGAIRRPTLAVDSIR